MSLAYYMSSIVLIVLTSFCVARMKEGRNAFKVLTGRPTGKRPLGRPRHRWEDNIRWTLKR